MEHYGVCFSMLHRVRRLKYSSSIFKGNASPKSDIPTLHKLDMFILKTYSTVLWILIDL